MLDAEPVLFKSLKPKILVHFPVIAMLDQRASDCHNADEDGGILLGTYRGPHIEIIEFTSSGPSDERQRYSFTRQDAHHQKRATKAWKESGHTVTFLGEWHTHPYGDPKPSFTDTRSWANLAKRSGQIMIFAVVAPSQWELYFMRPRTLQLAPKVLTRTTSGELGVVFESGGLNGLFTTP